MTNKPDKVLKVQLQDHLLFQPLQKIIQPITQL